MPSPEQPERRRPKGREVPEQPQDKEQEPSPYRRAASFSGEHTAGLAYDQVQEAMYNGPPNDLSAYRFQLNDIYHVAVLGEPPPDELDKQLEAILDTGMSAQLPKEILDYLIQRRTEMSKHGSWVEGHYRPGQGPRGPKKRK